MICTTILLLAIGFENSHKRTASTSLSATPEECAAIVQSGQDHEEFSNQVESQAERLSTSYAPCKANMSSDHVQQSTSSTSSGEVTKR